MRRLTALRFVLGFLALVQAGCASELVVRAPDTVRVPRPSPLADLEPLAVSIGPIEGAPDSGAPVGERGAAFLQPGGPIYLTDTPSRALRRTLEETLSGAGHRVVREDAQVHLAPRLLEFRLDAPRDGGAWAVAVRVGVSLRVTATPGDRNWDEMRGRSERSQRVLWRPGTTTLESVLAGCLEDLAAVLADSDELAAALAAHAGKTR